MKLAKFLLPLHQKYVAKSRSCLFEIKKAWISFKFAMMHFDEDCSPVSVLAAVDEPHAAFFKHIATLNLMIKKGDDRSGNKSSLIRKIRSVWSCKNKVMPDPIPLCVGADVPRQFVDEFVLKRDFIAENTDEDQRLTLVTLLLFNHMADFGDDSDCQHYLDKLHNDGAACRAAMRSICNASKELSLRAAAVDASNGFLVFLWRRLQSLLLSSVFGQDMVKSINCFHHLSISQQNELMTNHNFPDVDSISFSTVTADEIVEQCLMQDNAVSKNMAQHPADLNSLAAAERDFGNAQPISSSTEVEGELSQRSFSYKSQTDSRRLRDLEAELSELKKSLSSCRAENAELKQALAAAPPMQKP
jgi:hypothetical protein